MRILACDTSTEICSVCLTEDRRVVAEYVTRGELTHTERLMPSIEFLFRHVGWKPEDLNGLAVIHGPGSFTGLRISLSTVKGLALALNLPVVSAGALEVAAGQVATDGLICPAMDARRKQIFAGLYRKEGDSLISVAEPGSVFPEAWRDGLPAEPVVFCGPGARLYFDRLKNHPDSILGFSDFILARDLAMLAFDRFERGEHAQGEQLNAAYLRPSDAETKGPRARKVPERIPLS